MSMLDVVYSSLCKGLETVQENLDPAYLKEKQKIKNGLIKAELITTISYLALGVFAFLGIAATASGSLIGIPVFLIAGASSFFLYNLKIVINNMKDIHNNPKNYQKNLLSSELDRAKVIKKLKDNTFF